MFGQRAMELVRSALGRHKDLSACPGTEFRVEGIDLYLHLIDGIRIDVETTCVCVAARGTAVLTDDAVELQNQLTRLTSVDRAASDSTCALGPRYDSSRRQETASRHRYAFNGGLSQRLDTICTGGLHTRGFGLDRNRAAQIADFQLDVVQIQ